MKFSSDERKIKLKEISKRHQTLVPSISINRSNAVTWKIQTQSEIKKIRKSLWREHLNSLNCLNAYIIYRYSSG